MATTAHSTTGLASTVPAGHLGPPAADSYAPLVSIAALQQVHGDKGNPISMEWEDVRFSVGDKEILKGCTGVIQPRVLTGVMGPSGSGKTTMLNVLSGRQRLHGRDQSSGQPVEFSGQLSACGAPVRPKYFRGKVAYVFQDNAIPMSETPYDCFMFSACLRLPRDVSREEREAYVESMLKLLHLWECKDNYVGSTTKKGLSGGEQKRTAVGVELISNPKLLFMDEPLSGLDSYNARTLMETMKRLAESNVPVMMTLHQPSSEIFAMFTDIVLLHAGEVCYHGPASAMVAHFEQMGLTCPAFYNPSDFVMSKIQSTEETVGNIKSSWKTSTAYGNLRNRFDAHANVLQDSDESDDSDDSDASDSDGESHARAAKRRTGCCGALSMLLAREGRNVRYLGKTFLVQQVAAVLVALVYGWFFIGKGVADRSPSGVPNCRNGGFDKTSCQALFSAHLAILSLVGVNIMMWSLTAVTEGMQRDRACFLRERAGGYYDVLPFYLAKQLVEVLMAMINSLFVLLGMYWMVGLRANFFILFLELTLMALASDSVMMVLSAAASSRETLAALGLVPQVLQFAFSGLLLPVSLIPSSLQWMKWICPLYYGLNIITLSEFSYVYKEEALCKSNFGGVWKEHCPGTAVSLDMLNVRDAHAGYFWWPYVGVCLLLSVGLRLIAYLTLIHKSRYAV